MQMCTVLDGRLYGIERDARKFVDNLSHEIIIIVDF